MTQAVSAQHSCALRLPYIDTWHNFVLMADGSFGVAWELTPIDLFTFDTSMVLDLERKLNSLFVQAPAGSVLLKYDEDFNAAGCFFQIISQQSKDYSDVVARIRRSIHTDNAIIKDVALESAGYIDKIAAAEGFSRRRLFLLMRYYPELDEPTNLVRHFLRPTLSEARLKAMFREKVLRFLDNEMGVIQGALDATGLMPRLLDDVEISQFIYSFLNPSMLGGSVSKDKSQTLRSRVAPEFEPDHYMFQVDGLYHAVITLRSLPHTVSSCSGNMLTNVDGDIICCFANTPRGLMRKQLEGDKKLLRFTAISDKDAVFALDDNEQADYMLAQGTDFATASWHVLLKDKSQDGLALKVKNTLTAFSSMDGTEGRPEKSASPIVYFSNVVPFANSPQTERHSGRNKRVALPWLANLAPLYGPYIGTASRPVLTMPTFSDPQSVFMFDPFDPNNLNWNTIVIGVPGSGKSTFVVKLALAFMLHDPLLFFIDKGGSFESMALASGGTHTKLSTTQAKCINVFDLRGLHPSQGSDQAESVDGAITFAISFVDTLCQGLDNEEYGVVSTLLRHMYAERDFATYYMSDLLEELNKERDNTNLPESQRAIYSRLANKIALFTKKGAYGKFFDGDTEIDLEPSVQSYDMGNIYDDARLAAPYFMALDRALSARAAQEFGRKHIFFYDEAWAPMSVDSCRKAMMDKNRTLRKEGGATWYMDQVLGTFLDTPEGQKMVATTTNWFLLQMNGNDIANLKEAGFTSRELEVAARLETVPGKFSLSYARTVVRGIPRGSMLKNSPTPLLYAIMTTDADDRVLRKLLIKEYTKSEKPTMTEISEALRELAHLVPFGCRGCIDTIREFQEEFPGLDILTTVRKLKSLGRI